MEILGIEIRRKASTNSVKNEMNMNILIAYMENELGSFGTYEKIKEKVIEQMVIELYPEVKDKILGDKEFKKIINEIRLKVAKHFVQEK